MSIRVVTVGRAGAIVRETKLTRLFGVKVYEATKRKNAEGFYWKLVCVEDQRWGKPEDAEIAGRQYAKKHLLPFVPSVVQGKNALDRPI
jgi:hypothetical protein